MHIQDAQTHQSTQTRAGTSQTAAVRVPRERGLWRRFATWYGLAAILLVWQGIAALRIYPEFIIPQPLTVLEKLVEISLNGRLWLHAGTTLAQVLIGLVIGVLCGLMLGYVMAKSRVLDAAISPIIVTLQSTPVVAYAPLLVIWFGTGMTSKVVTCALIVFFPMLMNTVVGVRGVPLSLRDLMRSLKATRWQTFMRLEVPAALPVLLGGLKVSATLAVIGVVVGEFVSADAGLGYLLKVARQAFDTPLVFAAVIVLAVIARTLYGLVSWVEWRVLGWQRRGAR